MVSRDLHLSEGEARQTGSTLLFRPPTHTLTHPSETSRKALGQLLAISSAEHAGEMRKAGWGKKAEAICQHQVNVLLVQGEFDAELSPGEIPSFPYCV